VMRMTTIAETTGAATPTVCGTMTSGELRSDWKLWPPKRSTASGVQKIHPTANTSSR
jgi:hypothetical protein